MNWTVDVCILAWADGSEEHGEKSRSFLNSLLQNDTVAVNAELQKSYDRNSLRRQEFGCYWFSKMMLTGRIQPYMRPPSEKASQLKTQLQKNLPKGIKRFDSDDIPLVCLCFDTKDRHLISGDIGEGDFSPSLTSWLHRQYQICFHDLAEKKPYHVSRHKCTKLSKATHGS